MGQQQLLLIVLGVIIVGIAVVVGINVFTASSVQANADGLTADVVNLGSMAQQYYRKPAALAGGGNSFTGWEPPATLMQTPNMSSEIEFTAEGDACTITATGTEKSNDAYITVVATVTPTKITTEVNMNGGGEE